MTSNINKSQRNKNMKAWTTAWLFEAWSSLVLYLDTHFLRHRHAAFAIYRPASQYYLLFDVILTVHRR